jgi:glycosyltransferase involved in cell wall biosynthesis
MRLLIATDAWSPQVNGVVRTLQSLAAATAPLGVEVSFLTPESFPTVPLPTYPDIRIALPWPDKIERMIADINPGAFHIATEGPIGLMVRRYCRRRSLPFTTSFHTRFPEYISTRFPFPERVVWSGLRWFHGDAASVMAATPALARELTDRGFSRVRLWPRGVDTETFAPRPARALDLPRPIFLSVGRVAPEKNLDAFLSLDLPGSKVVVGDGPQLDELRARYPRAIFLGGRSPEELAELYSAADVFVFPSHTDTFGLVMLEALACGLPVAAFPVRGPLDVIGELNGEVGILDGDLRTACLGALSLSRETCRAFAQEMTWEASARHFLANVQPLSGHRLQVAAAKKASSKTATRDRRLPRSARTC